MNQLKLWISILGVALCAPIHAAYQWEVVRVIDGDTIVVRAPWLLPELGDTISIRAAGIDTPERGNFAKCEYEQQLAQQASNLTKSLIQPGSVVTVEIRGRDKYFRVLGDIQIGANNLAQILITAKLAVPYHGQTKQSWCP